MRISDWSSDVCSSDLNWGSLAQPGDPRYDNIPNRPEGNDVYQVPQNASYDLNDITRERINGPAVLQFRPTDSLTATVDYTDRQSTRLNSSHSCAYRMPSSAGNKNKERCNRTTQTEKKHREDKAT